MNTTKTLLLSLLIPLFACDPADNGPAEDGTAVERTPLGKADIASGACFELGHQDHCGGQSPDGCWCDDQCDQFGDCCADAFWCESDELPCGGIVGDTCPDGFECVDLPGDGCDEGDAVECPGTCEPQASELPCGGIVGDTCGDGFECVDLPDDGCDENSGVECPGTCQPA